MKENQIKVNAVKLGILMNFPKFWGYELSREAVKTVETLEHEINEYREALVKAIETLIYSKDTSESLRVNREIDYTVKYLKDILKEEQTI